MKYSFHHQRSFPTLAIARDLLPGEGATHLPSHEVRDLVYVCGVARIGLEIAEARLTMPPKRFEVARRTQNTREHAPIGPERRRNARHYFAGASRAHRHIRGKNEDMH